MFYLAVGVINSIRPSCLEVVKKSKYLAALWFSWCEKKRSCCLFFWWSICQHAILFTDHFEWQIQTDRLSSLTVPQQRTCRTECNQSQTLAFCKNNRQLVLPQVIVIIYIIIDNNRASLLSTCILIVTINLHACSELLEAYTRNSIWVMLAQCWIYLVFVLCHLIYDFSLMSKHFQLTLCANQTQRNTVTIRHNDHVL